MSVSAVEKEVTTKVEHPSSDERRAFGKALRNQTPQSIHAGWSPAHDRRDPVDLLEEQNATRDPDLVPVRHGRMMVSPFTFYRGAAKIMAADLEATPRAGLTTQLCGDAHLSNFGVFASPERLMLFDLNDFDETLPGPFEYDVKRMSASFTIAARNNGFSSAEARDATLNSVNSYRTSMAEFAQMSTMEIWYARLSEQTLKAAIDSFVASGKDKEPSKATKEQVKRAKKAAEKAHSRDSLQALSKLGELVDGRYRIVSQPPIVIPARELHATYGISADELQHAVHETFRAYRSTLQDDRRHLSSGSRSSTWPVRSLASAASARERSSFCSRDATSTIRCSCRSRKRQRLCSRTTCRRAATSSPASASSRVSE